MQEGFRVGLRFSFTLDRAELGWTSGMKRVDCNWSKPAQDKEIRALRNVVMGQSFPQFTAMVPWNSCSPNSQLQDSLSREYGSRRSESILVSRALTTQHLSPDPSDSRRLYYDEPLAYDSIPHVPYLAVVLRV
jgi:hypothetical protein